MPRSINSPASHQRRRKVIRLARGYYSGRSRLIKTAHDAIRRSGAFSFAHRRRRPGDFRRLWIMRINAAARLNGLSYSQFIHGLGQAAVALDRKMLADLAVRDPQSFSALAEKARAAL